MLAGKRTKEVPYIGFEGDQRGKKCMVLQVAARLVGEEPRRAAVDQLPDFERKLPNFCGFELPFFDFGPFDFNLGPEFDLSHFDRSFFELPEAGLTMISTISRLEGDL